MARESTVTSNSKASAHVSWLPMGIILLAQMQMAFNVNALPVSIGAIVEDLEVSATAISSALVIYSLFVAAFVMVGAKLGRMVGERRIFQVTVLLHGAAMGMMAFSADDNMMNNAQIVAGLAAAALVPSLVVLIAANYQGKQQEQALGLLAGASPVAGVLAFVVAGWLATALSWRISFGMLVFLAIGIFLLSFRLEPVERQKGVKIDLVGAVLAALAVILISVAFNNLNGWGFLLARPGAPINFLGLSPVPFMLIIGVVLGQAFFVWSHKRQERGKTPLLSLEVLDSSKERAAIYTMLIIGAVGPAVNFLIPLYIQIVQGRTGLQTAIAVVPYTLAIATSAILIVRIYSHLTPRQIGSAGFVIVTAGLTLLAFTIRNDWGTPLVITGLVVLGLGEGSLLTLLFNVLVSASPKYLAGDVGALRGTANNLSTAMGTALASALAVGLLSLFVMSSLADNPALPPALQAQVDLDNINFVSNDQLDETLSATTATPEQVDEAVRINTEARLRALKASFLMLAAVSLLAVFPAQGLPNYRPGEVPVGATAEPVKPKRRKTSGKRAVAS